MHNHFEHLESLPRLEPCTIKSLEPEEYLFLPVYAHGGMRFNNEHEDIALRDCSELDAYKEVLK